MRPHRKNRRHYREDKRHRWKKRFTHWLAPIAEKEYLRVVYLGKLQVPSEMCNDSGNLKSTTGLERMMNEVWNVSAFLNSRNQISGHLTFTNELHVCQLIEGKAEEITHLMAKIRKDPRVHI